MSFGGMLGGVFNSLVAPQIFSRILEYPLVLALAPWRAPSPRSARSRPEPIGLLLGVPAFVLLLMPGIVGHGVDSGALEFESFC